MRQFSEPRIVRAAHLSEALPIAQATAEVTAILPGALPEVAAPVYDFTQPVMIVGFYPSVVVYAQNQDGVIPTLDDVVVELTSNRSDRYTQAEGLGGIVTAVTLGALSSRFANHWIELAQARPDLEIKFRWKRDTVGWYHDALVSLAMYFQCIGGER